MTSKRCSRSVTTTSSRRIRDLFKEVDHAFDEFRIGFDHIRDLGDRIVASGWMRLDRRDALAAAGLTEKLRAILPDDGRR